MGHPASNLQIFVFLITNLSGTNPIQANGRRHHELCNNNIIYVQCHILRLLTARKQT